jgi:activating signal cointegrator 1
MGITVGEPTCGHNRCACFRSTEILAGIRDKCAYAGAGNVQMTKSTKTKNPPIKALTIRQPFPELILRGRKPFEIRSWSTNYRKPLLLHSAVKINSQYAKDLGLNPEKLIAGAFVGVAVLSDVRPYTRNDSKLLKKRRAGGGWYPNLFSWVLTKPRRISSPIKAKGRLGLFSVSVPLGKLVESYQPKKMKQSL